MTAILNQIQAHLLFKCLNFYLFYNDYETSYTPYINDARWHRCLRSDGLRVGGNRSTRRKPTCLTTWPSHMPTPGIEPGSHWWEASALPLRQPDSLSSAPSDFCPMNTNQGSNLSISQYTYKLSNSLLTTGYYLSVCFIHIDTFTYSTLAPDRLSIGYCLTTRQTRMAVGKYLFTSTQPRLCKPDKLTIPCCCVWHYG